MSSPETNIEIVEKFEKLYRRYYADDESKMRLYEFANEYPSEQKSFTIDYRDIYQHEPDLAEDIFKKPQKMFANAEEALAEYDLPIDKDLSDATVRLGELEAVPDDHVFDVGDYGDDQSQELVIVNGQVTKAAKKKGIIMEACYECGRCGTFTRIKRDGISGPITKPHECQGCERQGPFTINFDQSEGKNFQVIRLQRPPEKSNGSGTEDIDVYLKEDLVQSVSPGDRINIALRLQESILDEDELTYELIGEARSMEFQQTDYEDIEIEPHLDRINEIANGENPYQDIIDSILPSHMGHENIRLALALQMFGGVEKRHGDGSRTRGTPHIFLIGDPGTDKTGMLEYAADLSPRSVYTSGKNASSAGLTCAAVQDDFGDGGWTLEGGALVEADGGMCAIDEFDKMAGGDQEGVHEALSKGTISPSKAGITNVTLPANAAVLTAANPKYGRFDQYEALGEQIDLDPALISRFDLIFAMSDQPEEKYDTRLADHLLDVEKEGQLREAGREDELSDEENGAEPVIDNEVMRAYIAHAKETCTPVLSDEAQERLKEFYVTIRSHGTDEDAPVPITARKIEALVRLSEAAARVRLSDTITLQDAEMVISLVRDALEDIGMNEEGEFDVDTVETGSSKPQRDRMMTIKEAISEMALEYDDGAPTEELVKQLVNDELMTSDQVRHGIGDLKQKGEVYEPEPGHLRATS